MSDWSSGYVSEIDYTYGYYRELSPGLLSFALLNRGVRSRIGQAARYLELGFGQGLSFNIHAAATPGEFWGTDFNPSHVAYARELADSCGSGAKIFDFSFEELASRESDLPEFDVIALHGIWSWISREARHAIIELARRKLAVGGAFYLSYNCTPGWSASVPLRHILTLHAELAGSDAAGIATKIDQAIAFAQKMADAGALYFRANPLVAQRLQQIANQDRTYLAHEYFNQDWHPMPFSQVAGELSSAKLEFAASAHLLDHVDVVNVSEEGRRMLGQISNPVLRESVRDYFVHQQFRRDIFVKGARALAPFERFDRFLDQEFVLSNLVDEIQMKATGPLGEITLQEGLYAPVLQIMAAGDYASKSVREMLSNPAWGGREPAFLNECLLVLVSLGHVHPAQDRKIADSRRPRCQKLNSYLLQRARYGGEIEFLASPVTGAGVRIGRFQQLFLLARASGHARAEQWASFAWDVLNRQGLKLSNKGQTLQTDEENLAELTKQAGLFAKRLPILKSLGIVG